MAYFPNDFECTILVVQHNSNILTVLLIFNVGQACIGKHYVTLRHPNEDNFLSHKFVDPCGKRWQGEGDYVDLVPLVDRGSIHIGVFYSSRTTQQ